MRDIVFKHHRATSNLGDKSCSPYDQFADLRMRAVALDLSQPTPPCESVIYGGGKIMGGLSRTFGANDLAAKHRIAWGVSTVQTLPFSWKYYQAFRRMTLTGSRDWGDSRFDFAPCVTCMSSEFDKTFVETNEVVAYLHHWQSPKVGFIVPSHVPKLDNSCASFPEAIAFLGSGQTVVTNSYHGVYWALLLGKRVLCIPFSKKFYHYRLAPGYARSDEWQTSLNRAKGSSEMLALCRNATSLFRAKVGDLIGT